MPKPVLLVAEDNDLDALLLERVIERAGNLFRMVRVEHGGAAISYLEGSEPSGDGQAQPVPNLVLLDLKMPGKDGFAVLAWRQQTPAYARVPIVVFSSSGLQADISRAYALGANSYVVKPADPLRLERMVRALHEWWGNFNLTAAAP
jgi:CheY-like chemotaxis protein